MGQKQIRVSIHTIKHWGKNNNKLTIFYTVSD